MRVVRNSFAAMAVLLILSIVLIYWTGNEIIRCDRETMSRSHAIDHLNSLLSDVTDAETGQRGYLLTGDPAYLRPYDAAVNNFKREMDFVRASEEQGLRPERVVQLERLCGEKFAELKKTIDLRREKGIDAALRVVASDMGKHEMDDIRSAVGQMVFQEQAAENELAQSESRYGESRTATFIFAGAANLVFLFFAFRRIRDALLEREQVAHQLKQQKDLISVTLASIGDGVIITDNDGRVIFLNIVAENLTGWSRSDAVGSPIARVFSIINENSRQPVENPVEKVLKSGVVAGLANHTILIRRDGKELPIDDSGAPIRDDAGAMHGVVLIFRDFSAHKEAEKKLKEVEERFRIGLKNTPVSVCTNDLELRYTWIYNSRFGLPEEQVIGKRDEELFPDESFKDLVELKRRVIATRRPGRREIAARIDAVDRVFDVTVEPTTGPGETLVGLTIAIMETTELVKARQEAEAANLAKDKFLATLSHELRTPLTPVAATLEAWEESPEFPETLLPEVKMMRRNIDLEARLIDDLLDLTRIVRGKLVLHPEVIDVHTLLAEVAAMFHAEMDSKSLRLILRFDAKWHHVHADSGRLQQVFWNILRNAVKFTPEKGSVEVKTTCSEDGRVQIAVRDTGIGMTPQVMSRVFMPFEQGTADMARRYGGLGLGLAISKAFVDAQAGNITAASEGPGLGSTFTVSLPCVNGPDCPDVAAPEPSGQHSKRWIRILLVEDHVDTARVMSRLLAGLGHEVSVACSVAEAIKILDGHKFDVLLSDIGLPDGSGIDLIRQVRQYLDIPAIALTGFGMEADVAICKAAGFNDHLTKPLNFQRLEQVIQNVVKAEA